MDVEAIRRGGLRTVSAVVLCGVAAACGSRSEAALRTFSETYSCPRADTAVTPIEGVSMRELWLRANPLPEPPVDIQSDPSRLAVWRETQQRGRESVLRGVKQYELFHVDGCGHAVDYACFCPPHTGGSVTGRGTRQDFCGCGAPPVPIVSALSALGGQP